MSEINNNGIPIVLVGHPKEELSQARILALNIPENIPVVIIDNNPGFIKSPLEMKIELFKFLDEKDYCFIKSPSRSKKSKYQRNLKYKL